MPIPPDPRPPDAAHGADRDDAIPMLTEVVELPGEAAPELPESLAEVDWAALEQRVQDNVIDRLMHRSVDLLDGQLHATLNAVIGRAIDHLSAELHEALAQLTRDLVARAVAEELDRVHAEVARRERSRPGGPGGAG